MSGLNPPPPLFSSDDETTVGRRLMALVRATEKKKKNDTEQCDFLMELISLYSRKGLLQGNTERARNLLESTSTTKMRGGQSSKREHSRGSDATDDESLVLSALIRLLTPKENNEYSNSSMALAADACTAIIAHIQDEGTTQTLCAMAEQEVLLKSSRSLLSGLGSTIQNLSSSRDEQETLVLISCLQATTVLISLLQVKVPRPTISSIRTVAWTCLRDGDEKVRKSVARLLSTLALTGVDKTLPADAWSKSVLDAAVGLSMVLDAMANLRPQKNKRKIVSEETQTIVMDWIKCATNADNEAERVKMFQSFIRGLSAFLVALLTREAYADSTRVLLMTAKLPVEPLLDLCESMISFPSAAETLFFSTKKRLRLEIIQNGLLSPAAVVLEMANLVKYLGHNVLDATISAAGSSLLPFARQVTRITRASLLASSSTALQKVLDPTKCAMRVDGNRQDWLCNSVVLRTRAIMTYSIAVQTLGASIVAGSLSNNEGSMGTNKSQNETLAISCIGGSLLEQLSWPRDSNDDWATLSERVDLCVVALSAISSLLTTGGGYLPLAGRSLIDSIALTCFSSIRAKSQCRVAVWPSVKLEILKLGSACLSTPWPDGAMSSIASDLREIAQVCSRDCDSSVATEASACLRQCDALSMPRIPALSVVASREQERGTQSAFSLVESLKNAEEDIAISKALTTKSSRPASKMEDSSKTVEKNAKRQKVQPADDANSTMPSPSAAKQDSREELSPATETCKKLKVSSESPQKRKTQLEKVVEADTSGGSAQAAVDAPATQQCHNTDTREEQNIETKEKFAPQKPLDLGSAALKATGDESEDDDFLPEIVVDGGPDEEDQ